MAASYPTSLKPGFGTPRVDLQSAVVAEDVNPVYEEILAIEKHLGIDINKRANQWNVGSFSTTSTVWTNLRERLENAENGVVNSVSLSGGSIITNGTSPSGTTVTAASLIIKQASSQTSNLLEFRDSSNAVIAAISAAGAIQAGGIDGGNAASSSNAGA